MGRVSSDDVTVLSSMTKGMKFFKSWADILIEQGTTQTQCDCTHYYYYFRHNCVLPIARTSVV